MEQREEICDMEQKEESYEHGAAYINLGLNVSVSVSIQVYIISYYHTKIFSDCTVQFLYYISAIFVVVTLAYSLCSVKMYLPPEHDHDGTTKHAQLKPRFLRHRVINEKWLSTSETKQVGVSNRTNNE